jgi:hypothetical protein
VSQASSKRLALGRERAEYAALMATSPVPWRSGVRYSTWLLARGSGERARSPHARRLVGAGSLTFLSAA